MRFYKGKVCFQQPSTLPHIHVVCVVDLAHVRAELSQERAWFCAGYGWSESFKVN